MRKKGLIALAVCTVVAVLVVVLVLTLSSSNPETSANAGVQSWAHKVIYENPPSLLLLQADISQVTTAAVNYSALCPQGESIARALQHGTYPPVASISATYARYLSAAAAMYKACVTAYANPTTATTAAANLVKQSKSVVLIGDQLNAGVEAQGGSLAPPVP